MWQATINPMFNWEFNNNFFLQAGIGVTRLSENNFADRQFGSKFNFSDNLGVGYKFTPNTSLTYRISHYSNAGIKKPNPGIEMQQVILSHRF
jgi:lipid A 3-O-deacylase